MTYLVTQRLITTQWQGNTLMIILNKERARKTVHILLDFANRIFSCIWVMRARMTIQITPHVLAQQSKLNKISPNIFLGIFSILDDNEHFWFFHINFTLFWDFQIFVQMIYIWLGVCISLLRRHVEGWGYDGLKRELKGLAFGVVWEGHGGTGTVGMKY